MVILFIIFYLVYITNNRSQIVQQNRDLIEESYHTSMILDRILSSALDAETGIRGYSITGQNTFLRVYEKGVQESSKWKAALLGLEKKEIEDQILISSIVKLLDEKIEFCQSILVAHQNLGKEKAQDIIATGRGKVIMDNLRQAIHRYQGDQSRVLAFNLRKIDENIERRNTNHIVFAAVTLIFLVLGYLAIRRNADTMESDAVTLKKLAEDMTMQNGQLKEFAHIASHNLRSSSHNMMALIDLVEDDSPKEEYQKIFQMLRKVSENMDRSLNDLLEIIRVKKSREIQKEVIIFQNIYDKIIETLQGDILQHHIKISGDFSEAPDVFYTRIYLESAMQNLISNAIKYRSSERECEIKVYSTMVQGQVELHVQDNGLGIDMQRHGDKLFGLYQKFHNHPEAKGIGLFLTKAQIENQGGRIRASSDGKNGTTFSIRFAKSI